MPHMYGLCILGITYPVNEQGGFGNFIVIVKSVCDWYGQSIPQNDNVWREDSRKYLLLVLRCQCWFYNNDIDIYTHLTDEKVYKYKSSKTLKSKNIAKNP